MRKTDSLSEVEDADTAAMHAGKSADIKEDSSCRVVQNVMCLNTQSIPGLQQVSQLYPSTTKQVESNGVT